MGVINVPVPNIGAIIPEILTTAFACFLLFFDLFVPKEKKTLVGVVALVGTVILAVITFGYMNRYVVTFSGMFVLDNLSVVLKEVFFLSDIIVILLSLRYLEMERVNLGEYYALMLFATVGMMIMASARDLIMVYLGLETMALSVYVLAGFMKMNEKSAEAALKYFLLGVFISGIFLYGIALVYGRTGSTNIAHISNFMRTHGVKDPILFLSLILIAAGLGLEISALISTLPDAFTSLPVIFSFVPSSRFKTESDSTRAAWATPETTIS